MARYCPLFSGSSGNCTYIGTASGGLLVDAVFEPVMATQSGDSLLTRLFGAGKGSGAAFLFAVLWLMGVGVCLLFRGDPHIWKMDGEG